MNEQVKCKFYLSGKCLLRVGVGIYNGVREGKCIMDTNCICSYFEEASWKEPVQINAPAVNFDEVAPVDVRSYNVGASDYSKYKIQPWDIWLEYKLNPWDADIIKRTLRNKSGDSRKLDYEKIIHIAKERIRQIEVEQESI